MDWYNEEVVKKLLPMTLIGTCAAIIRALNNREGWRSFVARVVTGSLMAGCAGWLMKDLDLPTFVGGVICFAAGFASQEVAAKIAKGGKKYLDNAIDSKNGNDLPVK